MVAKPVTVGVVGVIILASALVLNYFVLPGEESETATAVMAPPPPAATAPKAGGEPRRTAVPADSAATPPGPDTAARAAAGAAPPKPQVSAEPSFDVVRVDPDGNTVLAGRGAPNAEIAIMDGGEEIGRVTTDSRGEWVFVPAAKLSPGQRVLFLRQSGADPGASTGEVSDSVVLVIPEKGKDIAGRPASEPSVPLVMVVPKDDPGEGGKAVARVLQAPAAGPLAETAERMTASGVPAAALDASAAAGAAGSARPDGSPDARSADARPANARSADARSADARSADARSADARPADARPAEARPAEARPTDARPAEAATGSATAGPGSAVAGAPPPGSSAGASAVAAAAAARTGVTASATPLSVGTGGSTAAGAQLAAVSSGSAATAEPSPAPAPVRTADAMPAAGAPETAPATPVGAAPVVVSAYPESAGGNAPQAGSGTAEVAVDVIDYDDKGEVVFSGRTDPGARVEVFIDDKNVGGTGAGADGRWTMRPEAPVAPGSYQLRVDKVAAGGTVEARVAFPFVRANPLTELPNNRLVVIQPGNNLWRIATRVYGSGVRYVEIFDANKDQILDPDLIFPGQVFGLPRTN